MTTELEKKVDYLQELIWLAFGRTGSAGGVLTVGATLPITSSGGLHPVIAINPATDATSGSLSAADKTKLDSIVVGNATEFQLVPIQTAAGVVQSDVYVYDTAATQFDLRQLTQDDILPGFSITGFAGGSTVEVGATVTNPAFTASYSSLPTSAQITNTDGIDSPLVLTTPFTAGTVVGAFTHAALAVVTFTLTAIKGVTKTAPQVINFFPRSFGGVGTAGASSATASGTSAVLNAGDGTLTTAGLAASVVNQTFGPFAPATQKIYVLVPHTGSPHTWKDPATGFAFAMNAPTTFSFTNVNGSVLSMDLYESTNLLISASQSVTCVS